MIEIETKLKKWGRSFGVIIPMEKVREANLTVEEPLEIVITKKKNPFLKNFGIAKGNMKKPTKKMLEELRAESWDE